MQPIHSGTTVERIVRTTVLMILVCGYAAWSLVDGYIAYPKANVRSVLEDQLGVEPPDPLPVIHPELTAKQAFGIAEGEPLDVVVRRLGRQPFRHNDAVYYFGYGGHVRIDVKAGRVANPQWVHGPKHSATDLVTQKVIGFVLVPIGLALIVQLVRVVRTRVSLSEAGLQVQGKPLVPFEAITAIRPGKATGVNLVDYKTEGGAGFIRLDNYVVKKQAAIVAAICEKKGFPHPDRQ